MLYLKTSPGKFNIPAPKIPVITFAGRFEAGILLTVCNTITPQP